MNAQTDWTTALIILVAGLVLGILFIYSNRRRNAQRPIGDAELRRRDLEARRDELLEQLRDPALVADERERLEVETANMLRKLDDVSLLRRTSSESDVLKVPLNPATHVVFTQGRKGFLWGVATVAILGGLGFLVLQQAAPRAAAKDLPADPTAQSQPATERSDPKLQQLEAQVRHDPKNLHFRNDLAQAQLERGNLMAVFEETRVVLDQSPEDSRALTLQAVVRDTMGQTELAVTMLKRATLSDPKNLDGWLVLAWVYAQNDRIGDGRKTIAAALREFPAEKVMLDQVLLQMKNRVATSPRGSQDSIRSGQLPPGHPEVAANAIGRTETPAPVLE